MDKKTLLLRLNQQRQLLAADSAPPAAFVVSESPMPDNDLWRSRQVLAQFQQNWRSEQTTLMLTECRQRLLHSIIGPFGLGKVVAAWDKTGGNVDTLHNARAGVYATDEEQSRYGRRGDYNSTPYHNQKNYISKNAENSKKKKAGDAVDAYTGQGLGANTDAQQDHLISAYSIHHDPAVALAEANGPELANHSTNLHQTHHSINESKKHMSAEEYIVWLNNNKARRDPIITRLEEKAKTEPLSKKEQNELEKCKQQNAVDQEKLRELDQAARKQYESMLRRAYYSSAKFGGYLLKTSAIEAGKMGMQQVIGLLLTDFIDRLLLEIHDSWHNGFCEGAEENRFWDALKIRAGRVAQGCLDNWRSVFTAFGEGAVSGLLSNLITTLINSFLTTARNLVRMIREGMFSLVRAAKMVLLRPAEMSRAEALDAALKIAVSGAFVIGGVVLEEYLSKTLGTMLVALPGGLVTTLVAVLTGCVTGLGTTLTVYLLDQIDLFGMQHQREDRAVLAMLEEGRELAEARLKTLLGTGSVARGD